jgi:hypothetical protein
MGEHNIAKSGMAKLDLKANAIDLLDTWGPGQCIASKENTDLLFAISIGGGSIVPADMDEKTQRCPPSLES